MKQHQRGATASPAKANDSPRRSIDGAMGMQRLAGNQAMLQQMAVQQAVQTAFRPTGDALDDEARGTLEPRFGQDLSRVRIQSDASAAAAARGIGAKAFTVGSTIAFASNQYRPQSADGLKLLAHEIAHVLQGPGHGAASTTAWQVSRPGDARETAANTAARQVCDGQSAVVPPAGGGPVVAREADDQGWMETADDWWGKQKEAAYDGLIDGIRSLKRSGISQLRDLARELPPVLQVLAAMLIDQVEVACDLVISLGLAIVGLVVGLVSGVAHALWGLLSMIEGAMEGLILFVAGFFDRRSRDQFDEKANAFLDGLKNLPANMNVVWNAWKARFDAASTERQTLMIGELTGEIEAVLLQLMAGGAASKGAQAMTALTPARQFAVATGRVAAGTGAAATDLAGPGAAAMMAVNMANQMDSQAQVANESAKKGAAQSSDPAPAAAPPKNAAEVDKMWQDLGDEVGNDPATKHKGGVKGAMKDAQGLPRGNQPGQINAETQAHRDASTVREVKKIKGTAAQSAHAGASSWLNKRVWRNGKLLKLDYDRAGASTMLLSPSVHQSFDKLWKAFAIDARQSGITKVPVSKMAQVMREAVMGSSVPAAEQGPLMMMIDGDIAKLGLQDTDMIELPYTNVKAVP